MQWEEEPHSHSLFLSRNTKAPAVADDEHLGRGCKGLEASGDGRIELTLQGRLQRTGPLTSQHHSFIDSFIHFPIQIFLGGLSILDTFLTLTDTATKTINLIN